MITDSVFFMIAFFAKTYLNLTAMVILDLLALIIVVYISNFLISAYLLKLDFAASLRIIFSPAFFKKVIGAIVATYLLYLATFNILNLLPITQIFMASLTILLVLLLVSWTRVYFFMATKRIIVKKKS